MLFLGGRKAEDPISANVNPFSLKPWDSPEGKWYLYSSEGRNNGVTQNGGYWKPMDNITIFSNSHTASKKTTLEFYTGGSEPSGKRSGWVMDEYLKDQTACHGSNFSQDYNSMCRVFFQNGQSSKFWKSDSVMPDVDMENRSSEIVNDNTASSPSMEVMNGSSSAVDVETGVVETNEQPEARLERFKKTAKLAFGICMGISISIIIDAVAKGHKGLILYKVSAGFAVISLCARVALLVYERVEWITKLIIVFVISLLAGVMLLAMNVVV